MQIIDMICCVRLFDEFFVKLVHRCQVVICWCCSSRLGAVVGAVHRLCPQH